MSPHYLAPSMPFYTPPQHNPVNMEMSAYHTAHSVTETSVTPRTPSPPTPSRTIDIPGANGSAEDWKLGSLVHESGNRYHAYCSPPRSFISEFSLRPCLYCHQSHLPKVSHGNQFCSGECRLSYILEARQNAVAKTASYRQPVARPSPRYHQNDQYAGGGAPAGCSTRCRRAAADGVAWA